MSRAVKMHVIRHKDTGKYLAVGSDDYDVWTDSLDEAQLIVADPVFITPKSGEEVVEVEATVSLAITPATTKE